MTPSPTSSGPDCDQCDDCEERPALPGLSRCTDCVNEALPDSFELPENTREMAEERYNEGTDR